MPRYDDSFFSEPAPIARVTLRVPTSATEINDVPMLADSGADATLLPRAAVERLGIDTHEGRAYELEGFNGKTSASAVVRFQMVFEQKTFTGEYLLSNEAWGILGRNVLNNLSSVRVKPTRTQAEQQTEQRQQKKRRRAKAEHNRGRQAGQRVRPLRSL